MTEATKNILIYEDPIIDVSGVPDSGKTGVAYSGQVKATRGKQPYKFSVDVLPAGLVLNVTTGAITGTPTAAGVTTTCKFAVAGAI